MECYRRMGTPIPDYAYPDDRAAQGKYIAANAEIFCELWEQIPLNPPLSKGDAEGTGILPGDVVLMYFDQAIPNHVGIYLGGPKGYVLHMSKYGAIKQPLKSCRVAALYRLKSLGSRFRGNDGSAS